jgi:4-amino-4-deoxy-L-arabinose transferase-like glycosyltransferase
MAAKACGPKRVKGAGPGFKGDGRRRAVIEGCTLSAGQKGRRIVGRFGIKALASAVDEPSPCVSLALVWTLAFVGALTVFRIAGLFAAPAQLYPEEAQYWVWSRHLTFGYFSKPPMIAWLIRATTTLGGNSEPWVRLSAPIAHGVAALALQRVGARLYGPWTGFWAAVLYSLMPGVQLSSAAIATDAPMLMFFSLGLWGYAGLLTAHRRRDALLCALGTGIALGLGALSKYAALYFLLGLALHAAVDAEARRRLKPAELALFMGSLLLILAPNLTWNVLNGFETLRHTAADADFSPAGPAAGAAVVKARHVPGFDPRGGPGFILSQFGVFGPIPFAVLVTGVIGVIRARRSLPQDRMLLAMAAPPLIIITAVAIVARANANWAAAAYCSACVLVAAWLVRRRAWNWLSATVASQVVVAALFAAAVVSPAFADRAGFGNSFKRARGWRETTAAVVAQLRRVSAVAPVTAIAVDDRFLFNALAYYGRDSLRFAGAPPLRMWVREARPHNEAETSAPLRSAEGGRVLFVSVVNRYLPEAMGDFRVSRVVATTFVALAPGHQREIVTFIGQGYVRRPRDRKGLPVPQ